MVRLLTFGARDQEKQNNMLFLIRMLTGAFTFIKSELWLSVVKCILENTMIQELRRGLWIKTS